MEILNTVTVDSVVAAVEQSIYDFVVDNIDKENKDMLSAQAYFRRYDKDNINEKLSKMKKKEFKRITFAGKVLYYTVLSLGLKINQNAFFLLAFLKDLNESNINKIKIVKSSD